MLNRSASLAMSTCVLKALPGKLDIKRHSPSILYFLGKLEQAVNQYFVHILSLVTDSKVSKGAKIRNRYNQVPHLTQDTKWESDRLTVDTTNESQEVSPFPAGDHIALLRAQRHSKHKTEQKHKRSTKWVV